MKYLSFKFVVPVLPFLLLSNVMAGQQKDSISETEKSYILADVNFISDAVFMGRKDSLTAPYLYPSVTYHHKSGLYARGSFSYLTKSDEARIDLFLVTAGYDFTIKKFSGDLSATKYFFNENSFNVISQVEVDVTASFKYDFDLASLSVAANTYFNNNSSSDFILSSEISHDFITKNNKFQVTPTAGIYLGSQNFYEEYYISSRSGNTRGLGKNNPITTTNVTIQESEKFDIMAVEFSLPMWYTSKSLTFSFLPIFVIPQSEATVIVDETFVKENLGNTFYWIAGISFKF
ncbi:MAG: hypothetical protein U1C58_09670 [Flavobacteriaceae bacterium]|jgi:hypothetical protein|nr:hypothetical protein [Flavobacteriaceae bacterium]MDZ4148539.1 hypothetical protein [Flavobacteriaceae bacterium]